jgi:hypothetical protein
MANINSEGFFEITNGPSKLDLQNALFDGNNRKNGRALDFELRTDASDKRKVIRLLIKGVEIEDGSGESWNIDATPIGDNLGNIEIYFRTDRRKGHLKLVPAPK